MALWNGERFGVEVGWACDSRAMPSLCGEIGRGEFLVQEEVCSDADLHESAPKPNMVLTYDVPHALERALPSCIPVMRFHHPVTKSLPWKSGLVPHGRGSHALHLFC